MKLPQFTTKRTVTAEINIFEKAKEDPYDFILGLNFLHNIKLDIKSSTIEIPMVPRGHWNKTSIENFWRINIENKNREQITNYSQDARANVEILDANYIKPNIENIANEQQHLTLQERAQLLSIVHANIQAFQGKRGKWTGSPVSFELKPFCAKPFRIPHSLKETMKKEVTRLVEQGVCLQ